MIQMTLRQALEIQARQMHFYAHRFPGGLAALQAHMAARTNVEGCDLDAPMFAGDVNKLVPRGGSIESACNISQQYMD